MALLAAGLIFIILAGCVREPTAVGATEWMAIHGKQCMCSPWEAAWVADGGQPEDYPSNRQEQLFIFSSYYHSLGIRVKGVASKNLDITVCAACCCPTGTVWYLKVEEEDMDLLLDLGFEHDSP